jgi:hypothetical protein
VRRNRQRKVPDEEEGFLVFSHERGGSF